MNKRISKKASTKKATAKKRAAKLTATDQVLNIIKRSKKALTFPPWQKRLGLGIRRSEISFTRHVNQAESRERVEGFILRRYKIPFH